MFRQALLGANCLRGRRKHELRVTERREGYPPDTMRVPVGEPSSRLQRDARLSGTAWPRERQQTDLPLRQQGAHLPQLLFAPQERRRRDRQIRLVEALERRKSRVSELVDTFGRGQVLKPVRAEVAQPVGTHEGSRGRRHENLTAVAACCDAGRPVHIDSHVALLHHVRRAGMNADPDTDRTHRKPRQGFGGRAHGTQRGWERDEECVTLRIDLSTALPDERVAQDATMLGERLRIAGCAQLLQQLCRALDIREEKGDGSRWEIAPHRNIMRESSPWCRCLDGRGLTPSCREGVSPYAVTSRPSSVCLALRCEGRTRGRFGGCTCTYRPVAAGTAAFRARRCRA